MVKMENIKIGDKFVIDNSIGILKDIEKANIVVEVVEKIDEKNVKVAINSILLQSKVERQVEYFLLR